MTFNEFLNLDLEDSQQIFEFYLKYLEELLSKNFPFDEQLKLLGAGGKFISSIEKNTYIHQEKKDEYNEILNKLHFELRHYRRRDSISSLTKIIMMSSKKSLLFQIQDSFQNLYSITLELINESKNKASYFDELKINDFYKPDNSNKQKIKDLIKDAIELIESDNTITNKTKNNIIDYLQSSLRELERERVNWTRFLGRIKETIIVLGALGSFAGGASTLFEAQEKLEQTTTIVQKTSVNINFNILHDTFNVQFIKDSSSINRLIELPENISSEKKDSNNSEDND